MTDAAIIAAADKDQVALKLAMDRCMQDPERRSQLEAMLEDRDWQDVAEFAAYCCQCDALELKPWQKPPC
jgi:hypothetical protein